MPTPHIPIARISIAIHEAAIQVEYSGSYPDLLDDVCNRANALMDSVLLKAQEMKIDIRSTELTEFESDNEEDEEA